MSRRVRSMPPLRGGNELPSNPILGRYAPLSVGPIGTHMLAVPMGPRFARRAKRGAKLATQ